MYANHKVSIMLLVFAKAPSQLKVLLSRANPI